MEKSKKYASPNLEVVTRDITEFDIETGNIYESILIISKRANQISSEIKEELSSKLSEFESTGDALEEIFENSEQIEVSRIYEKLPKPTLIATQEFKEKKIYHRNPKKDAQN